MKTLKDECVAWIREWFAANGPTCNAVIGMSGGKDSTATREKIDRMHRCNLFKTEILHIPAFIPTSI